MVWGLMLLYRKTNTQKLRGFKFYSSSFYWLCLEPVLYRSWFSPLSLHRTWTQIDKSRFRLQGWEMGCNSYDRNHCESSGLKIFSLWELKSWFLFSYPKLTVKAFGFGNVGFESPWLLLFSMFVCIVPNMSAFFLLKKLCHYITGAKHSSMSFSSGRLELLCIHLPQPIFRLQKF